MATFAQLRELDTETFRRAASGYSRLADTTALNADTVEAASRDLASWTGDAGAAATRKLDDFSSTFDQTHERLSELDKALADHASKMEQHQRRLANVVIDITSNRRGQLTIDLRTGQIGVVVDHEDGGSDRRPAAQRRGAARLGTAGGLRPEGGQGVVELAQPGRAGVPDPRAPRRDRLAGRGTGSRSR